jgi:hypothetical protein
MLHHGYITFLHGKVQNSILFLILYNFKLGYMRFDR